MRARRRSGLAAALLGAGAGLAFATPPAAGGNLTRATFTFDFPGPEPFVLSTEGLQGSSDDALRRIEITGGTALAGTAFAMGSFGAPPISGGRLVVASNAAGVFEGAPLGGATGTVFGHLALEAFGDPDFLVLPIRAGAGTSWTATGLSGDLELLFEAWPWTAGTVVVTGLDPTPGPETLTVRGSFLPGTPGVLSLVSPTRTTSSLSGAEPTRSASVSRLRLEFDALPEPGAWILYAAGACVLAAAGLGRRARGLGRRARPPRSPPAQRSPRKQVRTSST